MPQFKITVSGNSEEKQQEAMQLLGTLRKIDQFSGVAREDARYITLQNSLATEGWLNITINEKEHPHFSVNQSANDTIMVSFGIDANKSLIAEILKDGTTSPFHENINALHAKSRNNSSASVIEASNNSASAWKNTSNTTNPIKLSRSSCSIYKDLNLLQNTKGNIKRKIDTVLQPKDTNISMNM